MTTETLLERLMGRWEGPTDLFLDAGEPARRSAMRADVRRVAGASFARFEYTWAFEGAPQDGERLLCHDARKGRWRAEWIDSWHQSRTFMHCEGPLAVPLDVVGEYEVEGHPSWRWRTRLELDGEALLFRMWNVTPEGEETLAVDSRLARVVAS